MKKIPFVDLHAQYLSIKKEVDAAYQDLMTKTDFIGGSSIKEFEKNFAAFIGGKFCIACANGTDSIEMILKALGIGDGDEVIVPAHSWISTSEAVSAIGAKPVFVDVLPNKYTIDPSLIEAKVNSKTKAIIPVHLYGMPADMDEIMKIAAKHKLAVIEDCAQAHGAEYKGKIVGTFGIASSFSFYPGKNLGAYGDAGGIVTNDQSLAEKIKMIANHGQLVKHNHVIEGRNSRMDTFHASVLNIKLKYLADWNQKRREKAALYSKKLSGVSGLSLPELEDNKKHVFHLYVIQTEKREHLKEQLDKLGIQTAVHYPTALPLLEAYKACNYKADDFPVAFKQQSKILSLPIFPELTEEDIDYVCNSIKNILK
ncbi:MAG: Glutamine--scyllo-inositol transaminase [Bacteroidetes bacterium]|jgi:dTDP-4-amino-4,6-dideoxygalactose transaminase|nr:Glutamine--scyllo-inositol transaminase [Bacteroidota bacterium]